MLTRRKIIGLAQETVKGTGVAPDTEIIAYDLSGKPSDSLSDRKPSGLYAGHTGVSRRDGTGLGTIGFRTELRGDGANDWDPALLVALQSCGLLLATKTLTPETPVATQETISIACFEDGRKKLLHGAQGNVKISPEDKTVVLDFEFTGIWQTATDVSLPTPGFSAIAPIQWGHSSNALLINAVASLCSEFSFETGNTLEAVVDCGTPKYMICTDRSPKFECDPEAVLVATNDLYGKRDSETPVALSLALTNGTDTVTLAGGNWQITDIDAGDRGGILVDKVAGPFVTANSATGDNEYSLVAS